jgi:hypothetical protein
LTRNNRTNWRFFSIIIQQGKYKGQGSEISGARLSLGRWNRQAGEPA